MNGRDRQVDSEPHTKGPPHNKQMPVKQILVYLDCERGEQYSCNVTRNKYDIAYSYLYMRCLYEAKADLL